MEMYSEHELRHWGIAGMKWGVRKYRNYDGTLTEAGKARYAEHPEREEPERRKFNAAKSKYIHNPKNYKYLDDKELNDAKNRLQTESQASDLAHPKKQKQSNGNAGSGISKVFTNGADNIVGGITRGIGSAFEKKIKENSQSEEETRSAEIKRKALDSANLELIAKNKDLAKAREDRDAKILESKKTKDRAIKAGKTVVMQSISDSNSHGWGTKVTTAALKDYKPNKRVQKLVDRNLSDPWNDEYNWDD